MTQDQLRDLVVTWIREHTGLCIEGESQAAVLREIRARLTSDTGAFVSEGALAQMLTRLHQLPKESSGRWRWFPRVPLMEHYLGILQVVSWLETYPGPLIAQTPEELWEVVLATSGLSVSVQQLQVAFEEFNLRPEKCISKSGTHWVLAVPSLARRNV